MPSEQLEEFIVEFDLLFRISVIMTDVLFPYKVLKTSSLINLKVKPVIKR